MKTRAHSLADVTFVGPVEAVSGLGVSARGYVASLLACGVGVDVQRWTTGFEATAMQPVTYRKARPGAVTIVHLNMDALLSGNYLNTSPLREMCARSRRKILIPYWELAAIKPEWLAILDRFDEVWCASLFMQRAIRAVWAKPVWLVRPLLVGLDEKAAPSSWREPFSFFYAADFRSIMGRKNPEMFWQAYADTFSEADDVRCVLKLNYAATDDSRVLDLVCRAKGRKDMSLILETLTSESLESLQADCGCYVSPHRSEGLGLTIIEAMRLGKPVIATTYGGASDFVSADTAFPLPYRLVEVGSGCEPYPATAVWAAPDVQALKRFMRQIVDEPLAAVARGDIGRRRVLDLFGPSCVTDMQDALTRVQATG